MREKKIKYERAGPDEQEGERDGWFLRVPGGPRKERVGTWTGRPHPLHLV